MKTLQAVLAYIIAALMAPLVVAVLMFIQAPGANDAIIAATGLTLANEIDGGDVVQTIDHGAYRTEVHSMVFDALIGETKKGFIQVDWVPPASLPARIDEEIDADGDGQADFRIEVDTAAAKSTLTPHASWVLGLQGTYKRETALTVRVDLQNPSR